MLNDSIQKVEKIVDHTKSQVEGLVSTGKEKVEKGRGVAQRCLQVLDEVVSNVGEVNQRVEEISTASQEQSQGIQEITRAMSQLDEVTQQNASSSQMAASASEELSAQAESLMTMVHGLVSMVSGSVEAAPKFERTLPSKAPHVAKSDGGRQQPPAPPTRPAEQRVARTGGEAPSRSHPAFVGKTGT